MVAPKCLYLIKITIQIMIEFSTPHLSKFTEFTIFVLEKLLVSLHKLNKRYKKH